jgi:hypothetical protein
MGLPLDDTAPGTDRQQRSFNSQLSLHLRIQDTT